MSILRKVNDRLPKGRPQAGGRSGTADPLELTPDDELDLDVGIQQSLYGEPIELAYPEFSAGVDQVIEVRRGPVLGLSHRALGDALSHTNTSLEIEMGGMCLGSVFREAGSGRLLLHLQESVPAPVDPDLSLAGPAHLTFTPQTWAQLVNTYLNSFPELRILGWYHSHPGMGIFLSGSDLFIHDHFFSAPWQIAVVLDPIGRKIGLFTRRRKRILKPVILDCSDRSSMFHVAP